MDKACSTHGRYMRSPRNLSPKSLRIDNNLGDLDVDVRVTRKLIFKETKYMWIGLNWIRTMASGGLLQTRQQIFGFHKRHGIFLTSKKTIGFSRTTVLHGVSFVIIIIII
jgi:hypothetical protein